MATQDTIGSVGVHRPETEEVDGYSDFVNYAGMPNALYGEARRHFRQQQLEILAKREQQGGYNLSRTPF